MRNLYSIYQALIKKLAQKSWIIEALYTARIKSGSLYYSG